MPQATPQVKARPMPIKPALDKLGVSEMSDPQDMKVPVRNDLDVRGRVY
jgi:hypothetical protein